MKGHSMPEDNPVPKPTDTSDDLEAMKQRIEDLQPKQTLLPMEMNVKRLETTKQLNLSTDPDKVKTVSDFFQQLQTEGEMVKAGMMTDAQARNLLSYRKTQIQAIGLQLQHARLVKGRQPTPDL